MVVQTKGTIEQEGKMAKGQPKLPTFICKQCGHKWVPRIPSPGVCPKCHSPYWNRPKGRGRRKG